MKRIIDIIYCCLLLFIIGACHPKMKTETLPIQSFNLDSSKLVPWKMIETEYLMSYPESMILTDSHLIIQDRRSIDYLFHAINRSNGSLDFEFVRKGNGPNEYLDATLNPYWNNDKNMLSFYDPVNRSFFSFQVDMVDFYSWAPTKFIDAKKVFLGSEYVREMFACNGGYILMGEHGIFDNHRFIVLDNNMEIVGKSGNYPNVRDLLTNPDQDFRSMFFASSFFKVSPDQKKAIFATYKGALLQLFDLSSCKDSIVNFKSIQLEYPIKKEQITSDHDGWVYGFEDVYVTNNFVYAIYNGETAIDNPMFGKFVLVFNWEGKLCKSFKLDLNLRCLAVDEVENIIYLVACKEDSDFFLIQIDLNI